jgi:hypothetical protein
MLAAVGDPFHRPPEPPRRQTGKRIFAVGEEFGAEPTADIGGHDPHLVLVDLEHVLAQHVPDGMAALAAQRQRDARAVVFGDYAARVEIVGDEPLVDERERHRARRLGEGARGRLRVTELGLEREIAARGDRPRPH